MQYVRQLGIFFVLLVTCGFLLFAIYNDVESKTVEQVNSEQMVHARQAEQGIIRFFATYNSTLTYLSENRHIVQMDPEGRQAIRDFYTAHANEISSVTRVDGNGTILYTYPFESSTGANISAQAHVRKSMATHNVVISDVFTSVQGFRTIAFAMPVFREGRYDGILTILIPFDQLTGKYLEPVRILENGYAWTISQNGVVLYSPFPDQIDQPATEVFHNSPTMTAFIASAMTGSPGTGSYTLETTPGSANPLTFEAVYIPVQVGDEHWSIIVATPRSEILGTLQAFRTDLVLVSGLLVVSLFFFTYYIVQARGIIREQEQRQAAEAALRESEMNYRSILENMQDVFYRTDREGKVIMVSPSGPKLVGYDSEKEIIGKPITEFYANPAERERILSRLKEKSSVTNLEIRLKNREGSILTVLANSHVYRDADGNYLGVEGVLRDITDRKRTETALQQATKKLNLLTSITVNDIRNSLFTLSAYLELETRQTTEEKRREYHERESALLHQINLWLDIARNYQNLGLNPPRWHNVNTTFLLALSHLDLSGFTRNLQVGNLEVYADPLLETVFLNLAENIRHHAASATMFTLRYEITSTGINLIFEDDGPGIPDEKKATIFQRGTGSKNGAGLFMAHEILEITGITIRETGIFGRGTRFEMSVPREGYRVPDKVPGPEK
jgi:PAS domain S-box-containing protein